MVWCLNAHTAQNEHSKGRNLSAILYRTTGNEGSRGTKPKDCRTTWHAWAFPVFLLVDGMDGWYSTPLTTAWNLNTDGTY